MKRLIVPLLLLSFLGLAEARMPASDQCHQADKYDSYVLALSWQPGFCERQPGNEAKPECAALTQGQLSIDHLTLHGLWPNKKSCGTGYGRCPGKPLQLHKDTIEYIRPWMPSWYFGDDFGNYEWQKHGTCQTKLDDDGYFRKAVTALITVNDSAAGQYLRANIGGTISRRVFLEKINQEAGSDKAADNVQLFCAGEALYEIRVLLGPNFVAGQGMGPLLAEALNQRAGQAAKECSRDRIAIERGGR